MARLLMLLPFLAAVATTMLGSGVSAAKTCAASVEQIRDVPHDKSIGLVQGKSIMHKQRVDLVEDTEDNLQEDEEAGSDKALTDQKNETQ
mmetsp:Transcript_16941/g.33111  ORF Transcript_16941/g.33111 Transcript_16941/m.33111 type:complete len:90 (+) Transcript_16941:71-340(+)|eukprot:CAMPEP_0172659296 /NCGR_PEP_ID=MMETSP1074-20121228/3345_1 /TAXON_ID=2916 /ORGANISM="Ceratium fusus, Strain PA161109" /LENGTH=89 /DNA_ID=CAMNT_0013474753 /DNA_START=71 /DNA_END=340 /DNA_ORIENTATION=+